MKTNTTTTPETTTPDLKPIQTKHLAVKFNMKATALRRILRSMPEYADGVHTNYRWAENDKSIQRIAAKIQELAAEKAKRAAAAKDALAKRVAETAKQAAVDNAISAPAK